jgi:arsenite/tail-anchored protein-transporting ATPase
LQLWIFLAVLDHEPRIADTRPVSPRPRASDRREGSQPAITFFVGKGGVGKTTVSAAYAVWRARRQPGRRVLLMSTDPAHSLADVFQKRFSGKPRPLRLSARARLFVAEVDAGREFASFLDEHREAMLQLVESATIFTRGEIEPLLDSTLPGMAEIAALLALEREFASGRYDEIVVDTAPFGHTLRLFGLPEQFERFLTFLDVAGSRDAVLAAHFGGRARPHPVLDQWRDMVSAVVETLRRDAQMVVVTTPEPFALNETLRVLRAIDDAKQAMPVGRVVLNRVMSRAAGGCARCKKRAAMSRSAIRFLKQHVPGAPIAIAEDNAGPVLGPAALAAFGKHVFETAPPRIPSQLPRSSAVKLEAVAAKLQQEAWPVADKPLSLTVGKGGVGKTTFSAGFAYHTRSAERGSRVAICSTDPAPSLDDIFEQDVGDEFQPVLGDPSLNAAEIDAVREYREWADSMRQKLSDAFSTKDGGLHVDLSFERQLFEALLDVVPPGVDEIFGMLRITRLLQVGSARPEASAAAQLAVIDMAPTGHALELLRMPERVLTWSRLLLKTLAAHRTLPFAREIGAVLAETSNDVRELRALLADRRRSSVWVVMLAEPLPDRETSRLIANIRDIGLEVTGVVVNRLLAVTEVAQCEHCSRARAWQLATLAHVHRQSTAPVFAIREHNEEIAGREGLAALTGSLWHLA